MTTTASDFYQNAVTLRDRAVSGRFNELPVQAWAAVCRECAKANDAKRRELNGALAYTRLELSFFNNLGRVWSYAKAQVEHHARLAA